MGRCVTGEINSIILPLNYREIVMLKSICNMIGLGQETLSIHFFPNGTIFLPTCFDYDAFEVILEQNINGYRAKKTPFFSGTSLETLKKSKDRNMM